MGCWTRSAKALLLGTSAIVLIKSAGISTAYAQDVVAVELDPVTVVATKTRERVSETLAPVSVVRSAPVRSAPAPADVPAAPTETQPQPQGPADQLRRGAAGGREHAAAADAEPRLRRVLRHAGRHHADARR